MAAKIAAPSAKFDDTCSLRLTAVGVSFGGLAALDDVSFNVGPRELVAVVGPNGAGKSTLLNAISGLVGGAIRGQVEVFGTTVAGRRADRIVTLGVGRSFQDPPLIDGATVIENVLGGAHSQLRYTPAQQLWRRKRVQAEEDRLREDAMAVLEMCGLASVAHQPAGALPYGSRKLVDIARALVADPGLVLLDEPTSGLDRGEQNVVVDLLARVRSVRNPAMLLVEHHMQLVRAVADRVIGLQAGSVLAIGTPAEVLDSESFRAALVGTAVDSGGAAPAAHTEAGGGPVTRAEA